MHRLKVEKCVTDAVHGTIELTPVEVDLISSPTFRRLHNIRQLGLTHLVFPTASYSRHSHSLGACHVAKQMFKSINRKLESSRQIDEKKLQEYRIAALLHDIGHYPFSHTFEHALKKYYNNSNLLNGGENNVSTAFDHEQVGAKILISDRHIIEILSKHDIDPQAIENIFRPKEPGVLSAIISSDLDCDRLDYLMRTALHTGNPFGNVDINYIISQCALDSKDQLCLTHRAKKSADHFLTSRYFDYAQGPFNKTVVALEYALEMAIKKLLKLDILDCSSEKISKMIVNSDWYNFTDDKMITLLRTTFYDNARELEKDGSILHFNAILQRQPAKLAWSVENLSKDDKDRENHKLKKNLVKAAVDSFITEKGLREECIFVWDVTLQITKMGGRNRTQIPVEDSSKGVDDQSGQLIRILSSDALESTLLVDDPCTISHILRESSYQSLRVYCYEEENHNLGNELNTYINSELSK